MYISTLVYICHTCIRITVSIYAIHMYICYTYGCVMYICMQRIPPVHISQHITALQMSKRICTYSLSYAIHLCMPQYNHAGIYVHLSINKSVTIIIHKAINRVNWTIISYKSMLFQLIITMLLLSHSHLLILLYPFYDYFICIYYLLCTSNSLYSSYHPLSCVLVN